MHLQPMLQHRKEAFFIQHLLVSKTANTNQTPPPFFFSGQPPCACTVVALVRDMTLNRHLGPNIIK
jgi:hypothetical protein